MSARMQVQLLTANTCIRSPRIAFKRSILRAGRCSPPFPPPATVAIQGSLGLRGGFGWEITAGGKFIKLIRRVERFSAPYAPIASSQGSPGLMEGFGTRLLKAMRAN